MARYNSTIRTFSINSFTKIVCAASAMTLLSFPLQAKEPLSGKAATVTPVFKSDKTLSGGKISLPQGNVEVVVSQYEIAPGASLPLHKHIYPRYAYVFSGTLSVFNEVTGKTVTLKPGDFAVESINQWHKGTNIGSDPVKLLVIDQVKKGKSNVVLKP
ncbi:MULTISPECIES: cupin domain-containing protein [Brucella/Ochrobactrum group]|uniref:Cupin domain-containing protein n=1 Tax=Brucella pseudintermedia TaxID=370111 RepID=A0ABY5UB02_9HYPH|nr:MULTISPECIES: cupin domain-containing protein [Brucella/Ochrobactrum group]TWH02131.1 quercetin dioxygenase-like cupin family protein [Ochrobactrum sp. J50]UWL60061.1 cupin domain-containing protein [Brucella pseudintermedia]WPM80481.1 cupin domain-containing protein [Brucella pseudintermedia]